MRLRRLRRRLLLLLLLLLLHLLLPLQLHLLLPLHLLCSRSLRAHNLVSRAGGRGTRYLRIF